MADDEEARSFMAWFRTVRMQQREELRRHRFVVAGSIGIDLILRQLKSPDKLNDFVRIYVEPISDEAAARLINDLATLLDIRPSEALAPKILAMIGPNVPYFIHLLFSQLAQLPETSRRALTPELLQDVYQRRILGPTCRSYFDHYRTRLARYGQSLERGAIAVLQAVAEAAQGRVGAIALFDVYQRSRGHGASEHEFDELMADLECEWYLVLDARTNEYHFMVNMMRDWWRRWYRARRKIRSTGAF